VISGERLEGLPATTPPSVAEHLPEKHSPPGRQGENTTQPLQIPKEIESLLDAAIKRSVDEALQASSGGKLSAPREQAIVQKAREVIVAIEQTGLASYNGPLPPPQMLGEFDRIVPGLSKQIVDMALSEQTHRHRWENKALCNDIFVQSGGLILGWGLAGASILGAFMLADKPVAMGILLGVPLIQMIKSIVGGGQSNEARISPPASSSKKRVPRRRR
jgi:hypothetical protein